MKIKVRKISMNDNYTIIADNDKRIFTRNGKDLTSDLERFIFKITDLVSDWPNKLVDNTILDGVTYTIEIVSQGEKNRYLFKNKFPRDMFLFIQLISEACND